MNVIQNAARATGVVSQHETKGMKQGIEDNNPVRIDFHTFFERLKKLGEVHAARAVEVIVQPITGHVNRDECIDDIYLPQCLSYRSCYDMYMDWLGYKITAEDNKN